MVLFPTLVNVLAVTVGAIAGILLRRFFAERLRELLLQANGLCVMVLGLRMALASPNDVIIVIGLCIGGLLGYLCRLDQRADRAALTLKSWVKVKDDGFVTAFINGALIYCVGAMAIMGSLEAGLHHNFSVLYVKSTLDGIISIVLGSTMGIGVAFSGIVLGIYQGGLTLLAELLQPVITDAVLSYLSASGGVLIAAIGLSVAGIKEIQTINLLPGIFVCGILGYFFG